MATFKKPKRNFRRKVAGDSDEEEENYDNQVEDMEIEEERDCAELPVLIKKSKKKKKDKSAPKSLLSFGDDHDADGEVFKVKKSSHSKRIAKQLKLEKMREKEDNIEPTEKTNEKQKFPTKEEEKDDAEEQIRKLREEFRTLNGDEAAALDEDSEDEEKGTVHKLLGRGEIPDANMIHMIRKKRQMARDVGDFVPLDDTQKVEKSSSRLVREDDNDKSDEDDEEGRMDFSIDTQARERQKIKDEFLAAEHGSGGEESDHEREWEAQQIKKGVTVGPAQDLPMADPGINDGSQSYSNGYSDIRETPEQKFIAFTPLASTTNSSLINMDTIRKRLQERLDSMDEVHRSHLRERETLDTDIDDTEKSIDTCENSVGDMEKRYRFFQEMRGYVRDLVECLNEKVPVINDFETRMLNLLRNRAQKLVERRQQDVRDQCQDYMTNKSQVVMESLEGQARQRRVAERKARRSRRRLARESKNILGHHDGLSSDDEENQSEITKFNLEKENISSGIEQLFEDVEDDFSNIHYVREKFEEWKQQYGETYTEAYIGLCLPKLLNPFIRLQLIHWNPLTEHCKDFEESKWFETLVFYGFKLDEEIQRGDDDVRLLPTIVEKIILPKLTTIAECQWDPLSTTQTSRLVNTVQKIIRDYPVAHAKNKNLQTLLHAVVKRIQKTLEDDVFMPLYPKSVIEHRSSDSSVFFHRQSWTCIKLLGNILSWSGIISTSILQGLALDGLLNRYIILGLCNSVVNVETLQKCQSIVSTFPKEWFANLTDDKTMPQLENLCKYMVSASKVLDKEILQATDKKEIRDHYKQISKMLVNVHAMDHALSLQK